MWPFCTPDDDLHRLRVAGNDQTNVFTLTNDEMQGQATHLQHQTLTYDAMNRQTSVQTSFDSDKRVRRHLPPFGRNGWG